MYNDANRMGDYQHLIDIFSHILIVKKKRETIESHVRQQKNYSLLILLLLNTIHHPVLNDHAYLPKRQPRHFTHTDKGITSIKATVEAKDSTMNMATL